MSQVHDSMTELETSTSADDISPPLKKKHGARPRRKRQGPQVDPTQQNKDLKWGIWLYFFLLIFEGALRKWFLPFLSTPLLVARDPLALWLVVVAYTRGYLPLNGYIVLMVGVGLIGTLTAVTLGHGSLPVAIYGARILLFHFPLMFVIGEIFNRKDVLKMGKVMLWIAIPMTILIALQFYSPQSAFVNRGVGGDTEGAGFDGANGFFRPPGTFSFATGNTMFYSLLAPFVCYFWLNPKYVSKIILLGATFGLLASIPLSISRGLLFQILLSVIFTVVASSRSPKFLGKMIAAGVAVTLVVFILSNTSFYETASGAFSKRFETANEQEGGLKGVLGDRFLGGLIGAVSNSGEQPFFGYGQGMGTNVGSMLLSGEKIFLISEGEWGRVIGEYGPILGLILIGTRLALTSKIILISYDRLIKGDLLPWIMLSIGIITLAQGNWAQPTSLGFSTLIGGILLILIRAPQMVTPLRKRKHRGTRISLDNAVAQEP